MTPVRLALPCLIALAGAADAEALLSIPLALGPDSTIIRASYSCNGADPIAVQYVNAGQNHLAILPVEGAERIFVNVVAASGARYVSGQYEWWTKGETAAFSDTLSDAAAQDCVSKDYPQAP